MPNNDIISFLIRCCGKSEQNTKNMASREGFEPPTDCLAYHYGLRRQRHHCHLVCGLDHIFTISGGMRMASTEPCDNHSQNGCVCFDYSSAYLSSIEPLIHLYHPYLLCDVASLSKKGNVRFPRYYLVSSIDEQGFTDIALSTLQISVTL